MIKYSGLVCLTLGAVVGAIVCSSSESRAEWRSSHGGACFPTDPVEAQYWNGEDGWRVFTAPGDGSQFMELRCPFNYDDTHDTPGVKAWVTFQSASPSLGASSALACESFFAATGGTCYGMTSTTASGVQTIQLAQTWPNLTNYPYIAINLRSRGSSSAASPKLKGFFFGH